MEFDDEQYVEIEKLASCSYSPEKIAMYLDVPPKEFLQEWNDKKSKIRYHYDRGILLVQAKSEMKLVDSAEKGNITAYQQLIKQQFYQKIENKKKEILLNAAVNEIDHLKRYLASGDSSGLPAEQVSLYKKLDFARPLINANESKDSVVNHLMMSFPDEIISRKQAEGIYFETINFFNCNSEVTNQAWNNHFANKFENAALICWELNDFKMYKELMNDAKECRLAANVKNEFPDDVYRKQFIIYSMDPKRVKIKDEDRRVIAKMIDESPDLSSEDRLRLHRDNLSEDVEYEMLPIPKENAED
jgi:hypothetical protein